MFELNFTQADNLLSRNINHYTYWPEYSVQYYFCRNQLIEIGGLGKLILLKYAPFGIFSEALIECGLFIFCVYRYSFRLSIFRLFCCVHLLNLMTYVGIYYLMKAMIIIAWNGSGELSSILDGDVFKMVLSIFITAAILKLGQGN